MMPQIQTEVELIPLSLIDIPKNWRKVKKATIAEIAESVKVDGLLQPIGLRPTGDRFRLVYGRHRLEAFKILGREAIPALALDLDDVAEASATDAENLFQQPLSPAERLQSLKRWNERLVAEHPEQHGMAIPEEVADQEAEGVPPPSFDQHVAGATCKPVKWPAALAKNFTEAELTILADREVDRTGLRDLSKMKYPDRMREAISMIGSGLSVKEAIATASLPPNATFSEVIGGGAPVKAEGDMTDEEWLETYCGDVLAKLKFQVNYKKDAILYRHTSDARHKFRMAMKKPLAQGKSQQVGPFFLLLAKLVNTDHPKNWLHCGPCGGTGMSGDDSKCGYCNGHAYSTRTGAR